MATVEKMEKKYLKREKNKHYFILKKKENKKLHSGIKSLNKRIIKMNKEKIEISNKIYEDVPSPKSRILSLYFDRSTRISS